jgi:hypothetical protein
MDAYDIQEDVVRIYKFQNFDSPKECGMNFKIESMDLPELAMSIAIIEIVKVQLLKRFSDLEMDK